MNLPHWNRPDYWIYILHVDSARVTLRLPNTEVRFILVICGDWKKLDVIKLMFTVRRMVTDAIRLGIVFARVVSNVNCHNRSVSVTDHCALVNTTTFPTSRSAVITVYESLLAFSMWKKIILWTHFWLIKMLYGRNFRLVNA